MDLKLTFDDVGLSPVHNNVESRRHPSLETWLTTEFKQGSPILCANMDTTIGPGMARALQDEGITPIFHRFTILKEKKLWVREFDCFVSCGLTNKELLETEKLKDLGLRGVCFDVAQGHDVRVYKAIAWARRLGFEVIAGNICTDRKSVV